MNENLQYYIGFSHCLGIGPVRFHNLLNNFGGIKKAYEADLASVQNAIGEKIGADFIDFRSKFNAEKKIAEIKKKNIYILTREDPLFPQQLREISDPPICLYVKGDIHTVDFNKEIFFFVR
jgi:DNA processing protein